MDIAQILRLSRDEHIARVRKLPGMYFGFSDTAAATIVGELTANVIDLFLRGDATRVRISTDVESQTIVVSDDGPGLSIEDMKSPGLRSLIEPHFTATADGHAPHVHLVSSGVGLMPVTAVSSWMRVEAWRSGELWAVELEKGVLTQSPTRVAGTGGRASGRGTAVSLRIDPEVFERTMPCMPTLHANLYMASHHFPGLRIEVNDAAYVSTGLDQLVRVLARVVPGLGAFCNLPSGERTQKRRTFSATSVGPAAPPP